MPNTRDYQISLQAYSGHRPFKMTVARTKIEHSGKHYRCECIRKGQTCTKLDETNSSSEYLANEERNAAILAAAEEEID